MWHIKVFELKILPFLLLLLLVLFALLNQNICLGEITMIKDFENGNASSMESFMGGGDVGAGNASWNVNNMEMMVVGDIVGITNEGSRSINISKENIISQKFVEDSAGKGAADNIKNLVDYHRKWQIGLTPAAMEYQIRINNNKNKDNNSNNNNNNKRQCQQHKEQQQHHQHHHRHDHDDDDVLDDNGDTRNQQYDAGNVNHEYHYQQSYHKHHQGHQKTRQRQLAEHNHGQQHHIHQQRHSGQLPHQQHSYQHNNNNYQCQQQRQRINDKYHSFEKSKQFQIENNHHHHRHYHQQHQSSQHHQHHRQHNSQFAKHKQQIQLPLKVIKLNEASYDNIKLKAVRHATALNKAKTEGQAAFDKAKPRLESVKIQQHQPQIPPVDINYQSDDNFVPIWQEDKENGINKAQAVDSLNQASKQKIFHSTKQPFAFEDDDDADADADAFDDFFFDSNYNDEAIGISQHHHLPVHNQRPKLAFQLPAANANQNFLSTSNSDYFAASPRSGRHRGRITQQQQQLAFGTTDALSLAAAAAASDSSAYSSKVFRSLPDSENDSYHHHMQRLLHLQPPIPRGWPVKHEAIVEGDVILGGLMMVHSREDTITCGPIMPQGGIQSLEAMLYTIDRINEAQFLPNITLGAHILDDCDKDSYGLEMAVDFIKGSISNIDDAEYHCNKTTVRKVISGVVGAASSVTSIQVANLLRLFRIPQVSFFSTSPELSNKQRFEYFSRTIPSDHYQVKAMVEIVKRMGWSYVSIIYEESNYGIKAFEELEELLARHNICIAVKEKLVKDSGVADDMAYDSIVQKLLTKPRARGAIVFGSDQEVREVMRAVRRNNATGAFSWIGSDGWSARNLVSDGNEPEVEGTLSVQPQANPVKGFEEYFLNLTVENNLRNPWFVEFWEDHFQCRYPGSSSTPYNSYNRTCTTKERLSRENTDFEDQLQFVSDAVMAFAYALRDMHRDLCGGKPSLCEAMKPTKGADLLKYLRKVQFQGLSGDHFRFDSNGDGPARYNIIHFKQSNAGQYHWVKVGEYYEGELRLNMSEVQFKLLHPKPPESVCSLDCERGQAKKYVEGESCCWHCFNCSTYQIRHPIDETQCLTCQLGTLPDATKQFCQRIPEVYLRPASAWAIGAMAFSATGILVTLFVVGVFVRHNDTPIVRASGRELSYILLAGILMCYAVTFALVLKPTNVACSIQRFLVGFCFTVVYAALLTKTNRIARIFKAGKQSAKRPSFISPKSQLVICSFLIFVQILINGVWMLIAPSHAMHHHPTREDNLLVCDSYIDASYVIAFFYPIVLIVICTVYAVLTRKIPEAFNESKHIGFTMYTTCVIWLAFVPLYFGTANHVPLRITSMSVTISLSASVTIACLFSPKLYIILVRPERNVRQSMMPPRHGGNMHRTTNTGPSSMMAAAVVTAATCAQEEKIQKHITPPTSTEPICNAQKKKLCEMATQTIQISSIFTNIDSATYQHIPYADQYVPNNNHTHHHHQQQQQQQHNYDVQQQQHHPLEDLSAHQHNGNSCCSSVVVANNNKINQQHHHHHHQQQQQHQTIVDATSNIASTINGLVCASSATGNIMATNPIASQQIVQHQPNHKNNEQNPPPNTKPRVLTTSL